MMTMMTMILVEATAGMNCWIFPHYQAVPGENVTCRRPTKAATLTADGIFGRSVAALKMIELIRNTG